MKKVLVCVLLLSIVIGSISAVGFVGGNVFVGNDSFEEENRETSIDQLGLVLSGAHYVGETPGIGIGYTIGVGFASASYTSGVFEWDVETDPFSFNASVAAQYIVGLNEAAYIEFGVGLGYLGVASTYSLLGEEYVALLNITKFEMKTGGIITISKGLNVGAGAVFSFPLAVTGTFDSSSESSPPDLSFDSGFGVKGYLGTYIKY